jgi:hypothetical protein
VKTQLSCKTPDNLLIIAVEIFDINKNERKFNVIHIPCNRLTVQYLIQQITSGYLWLHVQFVGLSAS